MWLCSYKTELSVADFHSFIHPEIAQIFLKMESNFSMLMIIAVVLVRTALACYCPIEEMEKDRLDVLWETYNNEHVHNVYSGKVLEASCKCMTPSNDFQCVQLGSSTQNTFTSVEKKKYTCTENRRSGFFLILNLNKYTCDSVYQMAFGKSKLLCTLDIIIYYYLHCYCR